MKSLDKLNPADHAWLRDKGAVRVIEAIASGGGEVRFVGGCVRDALRGVRVGDMDMAVNMDPLRVTEILRMEGIKVVPTGIDHGTVTAVTDGRAFEITSLRKDVETDGRHASVEFTDDWQEDASRRDFTINAIYADLNGTLYDYFDGRADIAAGRVRFIGDARARIKEDVLRILRFFRMVSYIGDDTVEIDNEALGACGELAHLIPGLSAERVWNEIKKILVSSGVVRSWELMDSSGVLAQFLPEAVNIGILERLKEIEEKYDAPSAVRRLAALVFDYEIDRSELAEGLKKRFRLSNFEARALKTYAGLPIKLRGKLDPILLRRIIFEYDVVMVRDAVLLLAAVDCLDPTFDLKIISGWDCPEFPLKGEDLLRLGVSPGPRVGEILKEVETWWKDSDFKPNRGECLEKARVTTK